MTILNHRDEELKTALREVLFKAAKGNGSKRHFLTSYQVLARLPEIMRHELMTAKGDTSRGMYRAASIQLVNVLNEMDDVEKVYMDTAGLMFIIEAGLMVDGGTNALCALFRIP